MNNWKVLDREYYGLLRIKKDQESNFTLKTILLVKTFFILTLAIDAFLGVSSNWIDWGSISINLFLSTELEGLSPRDIKADIRESHELGKIQDNSKKDWIIVFCTRIEK